MASLFSDNLPQEAPDITVFQNAPQPQMPLKVLPQSPVPLTDAQKIPVWQDILLAKKGYGAVEQNLLNLNKQLETPDLTDEQKQQIQDNIALNNKALEGFSKYADSVRNTANAIGLDVSDYGSGKTLAESAQALNNYAASAVRDLFAMPSVAEQEQARFDELLARGVRPSQAHRLIKFDHPKTQGEYERRLRDGIMAYGTNPDGSINDIGLSLMHNALSSSPQTAQLFGTAFALPRNIFKANNARDLAILNNDAVAERQAAQIIAQWKNAEANRQAKEKNLNTTLRHKTENTEYVENRKDARTEFVEGKKDARTAAALDSRERIELAKLKAGSPAYKFGEYYNLGLELFGGDKKKAQDYAMTQTSKWKPGESKASAAQGVFNIYDTMLSYIEQGDEDTAGHMLQRLTTNEEEKLNEFSADFTSEENMKISELRTAFSEYLNFTPTSSDTNEINKQRADARDRLQAKYLAVKRGTKYEDELINIRRKRFDEKRRSGKEDNSTDTSQANKNVRALLGDPGSYVP